jgi:hypothetical protein
MLYGTTKQFLLHFGLNSLEELPKIEEFAEVLGEEVDVAGLRRAIESPLPVQVSLSDPDGEQMPLFEEPAAPGGQPSEAPAGEASETSEDGEPVPDESAVAPFASGGGDSEQPGEASGDEEPAEERPNGDETAEGGDDGPRGETGSSES